MTFEQQHFENTQLQAALVEHLLDQHRKRLPTLHRLWRYYRNPLEPSENDSSTPADRPYRLAQESGLPVRLRGGGKGHFNPAGFATSASNSPTDSRFRREVVIENDIAWRIHALVDFIFGKPVPIQSTAAEPDHAATIEQFLASVIEHNGGINFLTDLALLASIYGYADIVLRIDPSGIASASNFASDADRLMASVGAFKLEFVDATRGIPVINEHDYRQLDAYLVEETVTANRMTATRPVRRLLNKLPGRRPTQQQVSRTTIFTDQQVLTFETPLGNDGRPVGKATLIQRTNNVIGRLPVVHIQNLSQPFRYAGLSDIEPLIPLQDELNTRLSDRANRVTFQAFKMYLAKGVEDFLERPVGPGQMWATDNPSASITAFGGDASSPSEEAHIQEIREAMDKTSGVSPIAAGVLRDKIGNLTSENALRIALMGLLARTEKKRVTYGNGIARMCELLLDAAEQLGLYHTTGKQRGIRLNWPNPIPQSETQRLKDAELKQRLGVPDRQILGELGYADAVA